MSIYRINNNNQEPLWVSAKFFQSGFIALMLFNVENGRETYHTSFERITDIYLPALGQMWILFACNFPNSYQYEFSFFRGEKREVSIIPANKTTSPTE